MSKEVEIDISKLKKPASIGRKPASPKKPAKSLKKTIQNRVTYWRSGKTGDTPLFEVLKKVPKEVDFEECVFWLEKVNRYRYGRGYTEESKMCVGRVVEEDNPAYTTAWEKYEKAKKDHAEALKQYEEKKSKYDEEMKLYTRYKDAINYHSNIEKLADRIKLLGQKLDV